MPIRLIKKLTERLQKGSNGESTDGVASGSGSAELPPARGLPVKGSQKSGEVWKPGLSREKRRGSRTRRDPKVEASAASTDARKTDKTAGSATPSAPSSSGTPKNQASGDQATRPPRKRRSRGGKGRKKPSSGSTKAQPGSGQQGPASDSNPAPSSKPETSKSTGAEATPAKAQPSSAPWSLADFDIPRQEGKTRFHDVGLPEEILHAVADLGFEYCTPVQARVLTEVAQGHNVAGKAQTGTGKTAAFLMLTFKQFLEHPVQGERPKGRPRALVLAPTRELVVQIARDAEDIGKYCGMRFAAVYGGEPYEKQERLLSEGPVDLIAATPGRLLDFCRKGTLNLRDVEVLIIDEADRMLDMGFIPDVRSIIRQTPRKERRRTLLFSATLSDDVMRLASSWMTDPHVVEIEPEQVAVDSVKQLVYLVRADEKFKVLYNLLKRPEIGRVLIFANRRDQADRIAGELQRFGIDCALLSGAVDQKKRMKVLDAFRAGTVMTVVATDVAGRGLHVEGIHHVVNFDLPYEAEDYVHRIGRTGRAGAEGTAVSFACEDESFGIPDIERYVGETLSCQYPEDVLLRALPRTNAPPYRRPPRKTSGGGGNRRSGPPRGGQRGRGRPGGSRRR